MRLLILGAGSTGGYFGGRLAQAGRDVTFLVRPGRAAQLRAEGLRIISPHGDATLTPRLVTAGAIDGPYDAVLLTVKAYALEAALDDVAPAIGPATMILPVLNGMRHMDLLADRFGARALVGCALKVATILDPQGRILQLNRMQDLAYGELDGSRSPRIEALDATLRDAGFDARLSPDITREMWEKWVLLATVGGITCLLRGHCGEIGAAPGGHALIRAFLAEVAAVVAACGHAVPEAFLAAIAAQLTAPGTTQASSMYRDLSQGAPVEAEQIIGDLLARAARHGVATPLLAAADISLAVYRQRIGQAPAP